MNYPEGTIKTYKNGSQYIKQNGKWTYIKKEKKPKPKSKKRVYSYPPIKIPENIKETKYPGYYISTEGIAYRTPRKYDRNRPLTEYGLIKLNHSLRGNPKNKNYQYPSINVSIRNENKKFLKQ
jgi:hypothetical protein